MTGEAHVLRGAETIGRGLAAVRAARPIATGEGIHVVGAGGAGASAAALLAAAAGAAVSGCDPGAPTAYTEALGAQGIAVTGEHDPDHVAQLRRGTPAGVPVRLAATKALTSVTPDHPELEAARKAGIIIEPWQQVVADAAASHGGRLVAVAGTHGKSTSSGWLVHLLTSAGRDPGAFVGALLPSSLVGGPPATARWGRGDAFVVEADEYAGNFDAYRPAVAVVLNAEWDHPDVFADRESVLDAFEAWLRGPGAGDRLAVIHVGDAGGARLAERLADWGDRLLVVQPAGEAAVGRSAASIVRYAFDAPSLRLEGLPLPFGTVVEASLRLAGRHNAANAACVAAAAAVLGAAGDDIAVGLGTFEGVGRRLEVKGEPQGVLVIDDYGHHPTAIRATLEAVRSRYPGRPIWIAHEPLTFHRVAAMLDDLAASLASADHVVIADIWPGRDPDTSIASAAGLAAAVRRHGVEEAAVPGSVEATADYLAEHVRRGDVVLAMGGGRSYVIADRLVALLSSRSDG